MTVDLKMLGLDIETAPALVYSFSAFKTNIGYNQVVEPPRIIAFSAQWKGSKSVIFYSEYHHSRQEMLDALHALLDEADVVVTFNGDSFDLPWIDGEFIAEHMRPPSPVMKIDLYKVVKKHSRWLHKKLAVVADRLIGDQKVPHQGFGLWMDCLRGDEETKRKAWTLMRKYAKKDTALLWPLYDELLPWIKQPHPVSSHPGLLCRNCSSGNLQSRGTSKTLNGVYPRLQCQDCGKWQRGTLRSAVGETRDL